MTLDRSAARAAGRVPRFGRRALALEPRLLFDGAAAVALDHHVSIERPQQAIAPVDAAPGDESSAPASFPSRSGPHDASRASGDAQAWAAPTDLLVIDTRVTDWRSIADAAAPGAEVLVLDASRDGFEQIADALSTRDGLRSVQIVSHGAQGRVALGATWVGEAELGNFRQSLDRIDASLGDGADLMLYGCDIAQGDAGSAFLAALAKATHLDVAASIDATGGTAAGGNWTLESSTGSIESSLAIDAGVAASWSALLAPGPTITLGTPTVAGDAGATREILLGEQFTVTATFDNTSAVPTDTGFAPFFDLYVPRAGVDGGAQPDGLTIDSITYLGAPLTTQTITLTGTDVTNGYYTHPFVDRPGNVLGAPDRVALPGGMKAGDEIIVVTMPYGSYTANQPASEVTIAATLSSRADPNAPSSTANSLSLRAVAGFRYGADPLDNAASDPTIIGSVSAQRIDPIVYRTRTTYLGPEDETATGPNYLRAYRIDVDVADGIAMSNLQLSSVLDPAMRFTPLAGVPGNVGGHAVGAAPAGGFDNVGGVLISGGGVGGADPIVPGGTVSRTIGTVTGTSAQVDASMVVGFHVPEFDASGNAVIDPASGDKVQLIHGTQVAASTYAPIDSRDTGSAQSTTVAASHRLEADAIAIQKIRVLTADVGLAGVSPGDLVRYDLELQISDFFAFGGNTGGSDLLVTDTLSDGIAFLDASTSPSAADPSLTITRADGSTHTIAALNAADYTVALQPDGRQVIVVNVRAALERDAEVALLVGDQFGADDVRNGPMTARVSFHAQVLEQYRVAAPDASGAPSATSSTQLQLNEGDRIVNNAVVQATVLDAVLDPAAPGLLAETEDTRQGDAIAASAVSLHLVGVNGVEVTNSFASPIRVVPGDEVSYCIEYTVPTGDFENFHLTGYMPLPVFNVADPDDDGTPNAFSAAAGAFDVTPAVSQYSIEATSGGTPVVLPATASVDAASNAIDFDFGSRTDATNEPLHVRVCFTLRANDEAFADGLFLTGQAQAADDDTTTVAQTSQAIDRFELTQPALNIHKGVVRDESGANGQILADDTSTPVAETGLIKPAGDATAPLAGVVTAAAAVNLDTDIRRVDGTDTVRYAIVIENTGSSRAGAFDVTVSDVLPFSLTPASVSNLRVTMGDGSVLDYTVGGVVRNAATDAVITTEADFAAALFGGAGVEFIDPSATQGRIGSAEDASGNAVGDGSNVLVVTYDVQLPAAAEAAATSTTAATLVNYAALDSDTRGYGANYAPAGFSEEATVTIAGATLNKTVVGTGQVFTSGTTVVIGETVTYEVVVTVPEGTSSAAVLTDRLDNGLSFVSIDSIALSPGLTSTTSPVPGSIVPTDASGGVANRISVDFGTITNADTNNASAETITVRYTVVLRDVAGNQNGAGLNNLASFGTANGSTSVSAPNVVVREPAVVIAVTPDAGSFDAGDPVTFTVVVTNAGTLPAHDLTLDDIALPANLGYQPGSFVQTGGVAFTIDPAWAADLSAGVAPGVATLSSGASATFTFVADVSSSVQINDTLAVPATVRWTSLPGAAPDLSPFTANGDAERTGADGVPGAGVLNDYAATDGASIVVDVPNPMLRIVGSSEAQTAPSAGAVEASGAPRTDTQVAVGEIVRYRLVFQLPESTSPGIQVRPNLPPGLEYVDDGSTTIGFVADSGIASSTLSDPSLQLPDGGTPSTPADVVAIASPTYRLPAGAIATGGGSGADPVWSLGDLTVTDRDGDKEFVVVEFNARVLNESGVQGAASLPVDFDVFRNHSTVTPVVTSNQVTLTVLEPVIAAVDQRVTDRDASGLTRFSIAFTNTGSAAANDVRVFEEFSAVSNIANLADLRVNGQPVSSAPGVAADASDADTIDLTLATLAPGATATISFEASVTGTVASTDAIVTYTSLTTAGSSLSATTSAGPVTSTAGGAGTAGGERDGSGAPLNDYAALDPVALGAVRGTLWDDTTLRNGAVDAPAESLLAGLPVELRWFGPDGAPGNADDRVFATTTDAAGAYAFDGMPAGTFRVTAPAAATDPGVGNLRVVFDRAAATGAEHVDAIVPVSLTEGQVAASRDIGYVQINDPPTISAPGAQVVAEDAPLAFGTAAGRPITVVDDALDPLAPGGTHYRLVLSADHGTLAASAAGSASIAGGSSATMTITGSLADVNQTLETLVHSPSPNVHGAALIALALDDEGQFGDADGDGLPNEPVHDNLSDTATIPLTITPVPDAPVANPDVRRTDENTAITGGNLVGVLSGAGGAVSAPPANVDAADTDVDAVLDPVSTRVAVIGVDAGTPVTPGTGNVTVGTPAVVVGAHGTLTLNADGTYGYVPAVELAASDPPVVDVFTYTVEDDAGLRATTTLTITIDGVNDPVLARADARRIGEDDAPIGGNAVGPLGGAGGAVDAPPANVDVPDVDADADPIRVQGVVAGDNGGATIAPGTNLGTPVPGLYGHLTLGADGTYSYAPDYGLTNPIPAGTLATDVFSYTIDDGHGSVSTTTITISIDGSNDAIVANPDGRTIVEPVDPLAPIVATGRAIDPDAGQIAAGDRADTDVDSDPLTVTGVAAGDVAGGPALAANVSAPVAGAWGVLTVNADGTYAYTPAPATQSLAQGAFVDDVFTYSITDGAGSANTTITIRITGTNDGPTAVADFNAVPADDPSPATGNVIDGGAPGDARDTDVDDVTSPDLLRVQGVVAGDNGGAAVGAGGVGAPVPGLYGEIVVDPDGSYRYVVDRANAAVIALPPGTSLQDVFTYTVEDGHGGIATTTLTITIDGIDEPPDGVDRVWPLTEDTPVGFAPADFGFSDPDTGDTLSGVRIDTLPASGLLVLDGVPVAAGQVIDPSRLSGLRFEPAQDANRLNLAVAPRFTYSNRDARGNIDPVPNTFSFDIAPVNDPPVAPLIVRTIPYAARAGSIDARIVDTPLPTDPDVPLDALTVVVTGLPDPSGGRVLLDDGTPVADGQALSLAQLQRLQFVPNLANPARAVDGLVPAGRFTYRVSDGNGGSADGAITLNTTPPIVAQPPVVQPVVAAPLPLLDVVTPVSVDAGVSPDSTQAVDPFGTSTRDGVIRVVDPNPTPVRTGTHAALDAAGRTAPDASGARGVLGYAELAPFADLGVDGYFEPNGVRALFGREAIGYRPGGDIAAIAKSPSTDARARAAATESKDLDCLPAKPQVRAKPRLARNPFAEGLAVRPKTFSEQIDGERKRLQLPAAVKPRPVLPPC